MGGDALGQAAVLPGCAAGGLHRAGSQMPERGGDEGVDAWREELTLLGQMQLVLADGFQVQILRAAVAVFGERGEIMDVAALRRAREIADAHVFDHALS